MIIQSMSLFYCGVFAIMILMPHLNRIFISNQIDLDYPRTSVSGRLCIIGMPFETH